MKKLKLDVDALAVESFTAAERPGVLGTIGGNQAQPTIKTFCGSTWLESNPTCCPCTPRDAER
ncbi:MAG TPA: hypothetical protein VFJ82_14005 [Longimicrobium sp.]|nr:hypothetical protein [Longimicrobium sp.]